MSDIEDIEAALQSEDEGHIPEDANVDEGDATKVEGEDATDPTANEAATAVATGATAEVTATAIDAAATTNDDAATTSHTAATTSPTAAAAAEEGSHPKEESEAEPNKPRRPVEHKQVEEKEVHLSSVLIVVVAINIL